MTASLSWYLLNEKDWVSKIGITKKDFKTTMAQILWLPMLGQRVGSISCFSPFEMCTVSEKSCACLSIRRHGGCCMLFAAL
jgi:hypothetical protein